MFRRALLTVPFFAILLAVLPTIQGQPLEPLKLPETKLGQPRSDTPVQPVSGTRPIAPVVERKPESALEKLSRDPSLTMVGKEMLACTPRGIDFLNRMNQPNGRFLNGWNAALNRPLEGDHFLKQATSAYVLAHLARFTGDDRMLAKARQTILALLAETQVDPGNPGMRYTISHNSICNRTLSAGVLLAAIHELPDLAPDMLAKAEELASFLKTRIKADGSLQLADANESEDEATSANVGMVLLGMTANRIAAPATWKAETTKAIATHYRKAFQASPKPDMIPWLALACARGFEEGKEPVYAELLLEMLDWLCKLQYDTKDPANPEWRGGFQSVEKGNRLRSAPDLTTANYCIALAEGCRVLRLLPKPDLERYGRYRSCLERGLQFVEQLQYAKENTGHFSPKYAEALAGGFHVSPRDGSLRTEQSALAVMALVEFFACGAARD